MHSRRYLEAQTSLVDLFLPELAQAAIPNQSVNFNNTRQFDALLRYLEDSLHTREFVLVPSPNVLHILVTICCRTPTSNWTQKSAHMDAISASTDYMRQVNSEYDHTLYKVPLLERSRRILENYVLLAELSLDAPLQALYANMEKVLAVLAPYSVKTFFSPRKQRVSAADPKPQHRTPFRAQEELGLPKQTVVEVISDSEESDSVIEVSGPNEIASKYRQLNIPLQSVTSLSDLGSKTSGLGETTLLFRNMPHLLAHATPEPEQPAVKKQKSSVNPINQIQVYDDFLLAKKLESEAYDFWNLLRWMFECADSALQYQQFLFNSSQTNVHWIYRTYEGFFRIFFDFLAVQYNSGSTKKLHLLSRVLTLLGPKLDWNDRAVEFVFTGLGIATNSKCYPCYDRERLLIRHDPAILVSRLKTQVDFCDNQHSMALRFRIMCILYYRGKMEKANIEELVQNTAGKLVQVDCKCLTAFFDCLLTEHVPRIPGEIGVEFLSLLSQKLLALITNMDVGGWTHNGPLDANVQTVSELLQSDSVYASLAEDLGYKTFGEFHQKWATMVYLLQWMLTQLLMQIRAQGASDTYTQILSSSVSAADTRARAFYGEFLESRAENADIRADEIHFTLSAQEVQNYKQAFQAPFGHVLCIM